MPTETPLHARPINSFEGWEKKFHPTAEIAYSNQPPGDNLPFMQVCEWTDELGRKQSRVHIVHGAFPIALHHETHEVFVIKVGGRYVGGEQGVADSYEIPGGRVLRGESPLLTAIRQAREEACVEAVDTNPETAWIPVYQEGGVHPLNGPVVTDQYAFLCLAAKQVGTPKDRGEYIRSVSTMPFSKLLEMDADGQFPEPMVGYKLWRVQNWLRKNRPDLLT